MKTFTLIELADRARVIRDRSGIGYPGRFNKPGSSFARKSAVDGTLVPAPPTVPNRKRQARLNGRLNGYDQLMRLKPKSIRRPGSNNSK